MIIHSGGMHGMQHGEGMQHCAGMMGGMSAATALQHRTELNLSSDQVNRLESIQAEGRAAAQPHMEQAMEARADANRILEADQPDLGAHEAALTEAADHMVQAHTAMAATATRARSVLSAEQREKLDNLPHATGAMMQGMDHGQHGNHGAMQDGAMGAMKDCPMMKEMGGHGQGAALDG